MTREFYKGVVRGYVDAFNAGDMNAACGFFAPDCTIYGVHDGDDPHAVLKFLTEQKAAFGTQLEIEALCAEGDTVVARYIERGKFIAPFRGVPPTGRAYEIKAMHWFEFAGEKIMRRWGSRNLASIYWQIGVTFV